MTAFNDDPSEKKDDIERMSMADLLGMSGGEGDGRVQDRDDEPGSGIAKLAQMVATSSIMEAKRPSLMPTIGSIPPAQASVPPMSGSMPPMSGSMPPMSGSMPPMSGSMPAAGSVPPSASIPPQGSMPPMGSIPPQGSMPPMSGSLPPMGSIPPGGGEMYGSQPVGSSSMAPQAATAALPAQNFGYGAGQAAGMGGMPQTASMDDYGVDAPKKSSKIGLFIGIAVGLAVLGAVAFFLLSGNEPPPAPEEDPQLAKLQAQLEDLKAQAAAPTPAPEPEPAAEPAPAEPAAEEKPADEAAAAVATEEAAQEEEEEEEAAPAKPMTRAERRKAAREAKAAKKAAAAKPKAPKETGEKADDKPAAGLGALLDNDVASGKKPVGELPKTPSRADVKSAMQPIQAKASKCAKYSKGSVKLKIVVGSNGRVQSSSPVGGSADQTAANCVAMIARTARFPKFKDPTFSINYPITLK